MEKLKTLDDSVKFDSVGDESEIGWLIDKDDLKKEAINWIDSLCPQKVKLTEKEQSDYFDAFGKNTKHLYISDLFDTGQKHKIDFIITFFNLTKEDLKGINYDK